MTITTRRRRRSPLETETGQIWRGWSCVGENLIDGGGNQYGQGEICAIFYNRQRIRALENTLAVLMPPKAPREPCAAHTRVRTCMETARHQVKLFALLAGPVRQRRAVTS